MKKKKDNKLRVNLGYECRNCNHSRCQKYHYQKFSQFKWIMLNLVENEDYTI